MLEQVRIDKYLWAIRVFKTRSLATEKCKKGHVIINDISVKPSRLIKLGEQIDIKFPPIIRSYKVIGIIEKRVSASIAKLNIAEITHEGELLKLKLAKSNYTQRETGLGRPTKKDRRQIDKYKEEEL